MARGLRRAATACLCVAALAGVAPAPSWSQTSAPGWALLRRASQAQDVPSTDAERARSPLPPDRNRVRYLVRPHDTDPQIDHFLKDHYVLYSRAVPQNGKLFIFFPGTWARPFLYQRLLDEAARAGYKAIGLEYPDDTMQPTASAVGQICARDPNPDCSARVRAVRIDGGAAAGVQVSRPNGIQNRLEKLLRYLAERYPADGWAGFLVGGHVNWARTALGGHSQGAGMAAFLAKVHPVTRVALWSGPGDYVAATRGAAPWMMAPSATPADRWYGVVHVAEAGAGRLLAGYDALGVPGPPGIADVSVPAGTHRFIVTLPPRPGPAMPAIAGANHGSVAVDAQTPLSADGQPLYRAVWQAMIGR